VHGLSPYRRRVRAAGGRGQQILASHVGGLLLRLVYLPTCRRFAPSREIGLKEETYGWNLEMVMRVAAARLPALEIAVEQRRRIGWRIEGVRHPHRWRQRGLVNIDDVGSLRLEL
jgi:hypothetical protein